ncbi:hypothetical protein JB92DRAFT_2837861 [Gautieria morchelliformis]|nr:hypothetical protein JB92DRAFT_2837861 [Gautieria morchelliformis]
MCGGTVDLRVPSRYSCTLLPEYQTGNISRSAHSHVRPHFHVRSVQLIPTYAVGLCGIKNMQEMSAVQLIPAYNASSGQEMRHKSGHGIKTYTGTGGSRGAFRISQIFLHAT